VASGPVGPLLRNLQLASAAPGVRSGAQPQQESWQAAYRACDGQRARRLVLARKPRDQILRLIAELAALPPCVAFVEPPRAPNDSICKNWMKIHINLALILIEDRPAEYLGERFGVLAKRKQPAPDVLLTFASPASVVIRHAMQMCVHRIELSAKAAKRHDDLDDMRKVSFFGRAPFVAHVPDLPRLAPTSVYPPPMLRRARGAQVRS